MGVCLSRGNIGRYYESRKIWLPNGISSQSTWNIDSYRGNSIMQGRCQGLRLLKLLCDSETLLPLHVFGINNIEINVFWNWNYTTKNKNNKPFRAKNYFIIHYFSFTSLQSRLM